MDSPDEGLDSYWNLVDDFINKANEFADGENTGVVASALVQAAARYSSFYAATSSESRNDLKDDKDALIRDFSREFKKQFADNLEDYIEHYKIYLAGEQD